MSPLTTPTLAERVRSILTLPRRQLRALFPGGVPRWIWYVFQVIALGLALVGVSYSWSEFPRDLQVEPVYFAVAAGIYVLAFIMHLLGWHMLTRIFFGRLGLRENAEAIASSNLVKYLPTIVWYIANRSHFYHQRGIPQKSVVVASLSELALMVGSGAVLLVALWAGGSASPLLAVPVLVAGAGVLLWALARHAGGGLASLWRWGLALLMYAGSWPMGVLTLWAIMRAFLVVGPSDLLTLGNIWLLAGLASYAVSLTLGAIGIAREITLTVLIAQHWPLAVGVAAAISVKLVLTLGEVGCSLLLIGVFQLWGRLSAGPTEGGVR